jgi:hypothetical protein
VVTTVTTHTVVIHGTAGKTIVSLLMLMLMLMLMLVLVLVLR